MFNIIYKTNADPDIIPPMQEWAWRKWVQVGVDRILGNSRINYKVFVQSNNRALLAKQQAEASDS